MGRSGADVGVVLSGGGINGALLELGFLKRLRESPLWERVGWIYGTSAGALAGSMAALDRLDELEQFLLELRADEVFRPRRMWQLLLGGLHDYTLPETVAARIGGMDKLGSALAAADVELVVFATDVSDHLEPEGRDFELAYSSRSTAPQTMGDAILASAAISALVLPVRVDGVIATDGGWVRNFPLEHAYRNPAVAGIVAFRYVIRYRQSQLGYLHRVRERLDRFGAVPPVRALLDELRLAEERAERGEPAHYPELIVRLMRVTVGRNTALEEQLAAERDESVVELQRLRAEVIDTAVAAAPRRRRRRVREDLERRFAEANFPFRHDRHVPRLVVSGDAGDDGLDQLFRAGETWPRERKRRLIERGYELADEELARNPGFPDVEE